ncbi:MAG: [FeFe] hydrogenase, group A [Lachnospiraceae bacterium]|nr:[FeFe] hydrogenase, group A [Lachnospiraceae bacterium]
MGFMTIDGRQVEFTNEKNVLSVIRKANIDVPTLCMKPELSIFGACRLCTVEDASGKMFASCSEEPRDGMVIKTNTERLRKYRKLIIELLLAAHDRDCTTCQESGSCTLQNLARRYGITDVRFKNYKEPLPLDFSSPSIVRDPNKCILCGNCVRECAEIQGIGVLGFVNRGSEATVSPAFDKPIGETDCVNCGQCRLVCPTAAITIKHNREDVWQAIADPNTRVIAQVAPAVRVAIGKEFGLTNGKSVMGKLVAALHRMGFDEVYDTTFSADLTIVEETAEFLNRVQNGGKLPLLTSCCPAWVKFVDDQYPDFRENVSTCRSPQGMMSALVKEYFRKPENNPGGKNTVVVSIMPCTAKKMEANRPNSFTDGEKDTDFVLTTTEVVQMIKMTGVDFAGLEGEASDVPFGFGSGGGVIFGVTGGVTEAVIRHLVDGHDKATMDAVANCGVRGTDGENEFIREFTVPYNGLDVKICVVSGLGNARKVMDAVKSGEKEYHLIEVMACRRGCVNGGGQPYLEHIKFVDDRTDGIYRADGVSVVKNCDENPTVQSLYDGFLKNREHHLLHNPFFAGK